MKIKSEKYVTADEMTHSKTDPVKLRAESIAYEIADKARAAVQISTCIRESGDTHVLGVLHVYTDAQMRKIMKCVRGNGVNIDHLIELLNL